MIVSMIVAMARNRVIGRDNQLPWRLSADLRHFKALTMGKPVIMGRKTWESIGRPLPGRHNIVLSRDSSFQAEGCQVVHSIEHALLAAGDSPEVMIMGGAGLYSQFLDRADRIYLTQVDAEVEGDTWFPELQAGCWRETQRQSYPADERNEFDYHFITLERDRARTPVSRVSQ